VDVVRQGLSSALLEHEFVQLRERASEGHAIQSFTQDVPGCSGAIGACS
jgi:hypothetical protein